MNNKDVNTQFFLLYILYILFLTAHLFYFNYEANNNIIFTLK